MKPIREYLKPFLKRFGMRVEGLDKAGHRGINAVYLLSCL